MRWMWFVALLAACADRPLWLPEATVDLGAADLSQPDLSRPDLSSPPDLASCKTAFEVDHSEGWLIAGIDAATGDFDGDGNLDLVIADLGQSLDFAPFEGSQLVLLLGKGDGTFETPRFFPSAGAPYGVFVGDFDEDGRSDVITYLWDMQPNSQATLELWRGHEDGTLTRTSLDMQARARPIVGDLDGDGHLDLTMVKSDGLTLLAGRGDGSFDERAVKTTMGVGPLLPAVGDFDADGKLDLAVLSGGGYLPILRNGTFAVMSSKSFLVSDYSVSWLRAADFDGDGKLDLMAAVKAKTLFFHGKGDGTFEDPTEVKDDSNEPLDWKPIRQVADHDLIGMTAQGLELARRGMDGRYARNVIPASPGQWLPAVGDFDGDGHDDVVSLGAASWQLWLSRAGSLEPQPAVGGGDPVAIELADVDSDGKLDVVLAQGVDNGLSFRSGGLGTLQRLAEVPPTSSLCSGDFDGDGMIDFVTGSRIVHGRSIGILGTAEYSSCAGSGDFDRDGQLDLLMVSGDGEVKTLAGRGDGTFAPAVSSYAGVKANGFPRQLADSDGDGTLDLMWLEMDGLKIAHGKTIEARPIGSYDPYNGFRLSSLAAVEDLDEDHQADLIVVDGKHNGIQVSAHGATTSYSLGDWPRSIAAGDLDGDGHVDVVASVRAGIAWLKGNGDGSLGPVQLIPIPGNAAGPLVVRDLDGDGRLDLVSAGRPGGEVAVVHNVCR